MRGGADCEIPCAEGSLPGYRARPASGRGPAVVVLQEWWGLVDPIRGVCDRLAREGFVALAPDLYRGEATRDPDVASRLMMDLDLPRAAGDVDAAVEALLRDPATEGGRVGILGFCMGGQLALSAGCRNPRLGAVVDCYGIHPSVEVDPSGMEAAVLGVFAENDEFVPLDRVQALERRLRDAGVRVRFRVHVGVQHAFLNEARPEVFDAAAATEAWGEILAFLRAELAS